MLRNRPSLYGIFLAVFLHLAAPGQAAATPVPSWTCSFSVYMVGNTYEFFRLGYDSWDGEGLVVCKNNLSGESYSLRHTFNYRSWSTTSGADTRNSFIMESFAFSVENPKMLVGHFDAQGTSHGGSQDVLSYLALSNSETRIYIAIKDPSMGSSLLPSLNWGSLTIAEAPRID
ncbi:MAG: hypothetical protein KDD43_07180 [Bdellovibrionales bacterium]|nr:hypothetical protein [Bdellovibrionales bacterium]